MVHGYGPDFEGKWFRGLRVCHADVFDRYFHLAVPEGDIWQADLDRILSLMSHCEGLVAEFRALNGRGLLAVGLNRLEAYKENLDLQYAVPFVTALFDIGDELPDDQPARLFAIKPDMYAARIIHWYLKQERDAQKRGQILKEVMKATTGVHLPAMKTSFEERKKGREHEDIEDPDSFLVTADDLTELQKICLEKIMRAAESGSLKSHPKLVEILYWWREWSSAEEPKSWVEKLTESEDGLLCFLTAFLQPSTSQTIGDYVARIHWRIKLTNVEDFVSADVLTERVEQLEFESLGQKEQEAIRAFRKALKRRQEGKSDDYWRDDDDE